MGKWEFFSRKSKKIINRTNLELHLSLDELGSFFLQTSVEMLIVKPMRALLNYPSQRLLQLWQPQLDVSDSNQCRPQLIGTFGFLSSYMKKIIIITLTGNRRFLIYSPSKMSSKEEPKSSAKAPSNIKDPSDCWRGTTFINFFARSIFM